MGACCCKASEEDAENSREGSIEEENINDSREEIDRIETDPVLEDRHEDVETSPSPETSNADEFRVDCASGKEILVHTSDQKPESNTGDGKAFKKTVVSKPQTGQRNRYRESNREYWNAIANHKNIGMFHVEEVFDGLPLYPYAQDPADPSGYNRNVRVHRPTYSKFLNEEWEKDCPVNSYSDWRRVDVITTTEKRESCKRPGPGRTITVDTNGVIKETGQKSVDGWFQTDGVYIEPEFRHDSWTSWMIGRD